MKLPLSKCCSKKKKKSKSRKNWDRSVPRLWWKWNVRKKSSTWWIFDWIKFSIFSIKMEEMKWPLFNNNRSHKIQCLHKMAWTKSLYLVCGHIKLPIFYATCYDFEMIRIKTLNKCYCGLTKEWPHVITLREQYKWCGRTEYTCTVTNDCWIKFSID